ncbi:MAG TPA: FmdB family zinc ribbon protein [Chloroflexota bacterium]|nr:FmdB family zinc ribbon protein [Chloroflexota bacterium]
MPLYEYECRDCKNRFEVRQRMTEEPISVCPTCGGPCRRVIHPVGIVFKGGGFYITDNRKGEESSTSSNSSEKKTENKPTEGKATEGKASESKTESKPAEKASTSSSSSESKPAASKGT